MSKLRLTILGSLLAGLLLLSRPVAGEQVVPLPIAGLAAKAQLIVHGTVLGSTVHRDSAGRIYTAVRLQVEEVWKGSLGTNRFTIVQAGGVLGDQVAVVSGGVEYAVGEEIVAFLVLNQRGEGVSIGLSQGKFHVWRDTATGEQLARNRFHGRNPSAATAPTGRGRPAGVWDRLTLADLKRRAQGGAN